MGCRYSELQPCRHFTSGTSSSSSSVLGTLVVVFTCSHPFGSPHSPGLRLLRLAWMLLNPPVPHGSCSGPSRACPWRHLPPPPCLVWPHHPQAGPRGRRAPRSHCTACRGLIVIADAFCAINNLGVMIKMTTVGWKARLAVASAVEEFLRRDPLPRGVPQCPCNWDALLASLPADYLLLCCRSLQLL